ncbi:hypothetical protein BO70DRAFT_413915 [Aspergillus heteromorphus CBS 117.55]|uniref:MYND-type domain-containing protein n=1 Tax=Aspergillus heteromorphus CBS 117.55 TaxID=1448321 RepID=A0A317VE88_9EURO|nr:uncharacterized protein BO70DRAFT_413915 [Aspergillus heteromorphus CBS 117.55]PWY72275.1 hypothetical protein BO70DRAFT_413915 [Aspergillus heteromorphus CBS 117.55]
MPPAVNLCHWLSCLFPRVKGKTVASQPLPVGCGQCGKTVDLKLCGSCRAMHYCSSEHQMMHHATHRPTCELVRKARERFKFEEGQAMIACDGPINLANVNDTFGADYLVVHFYLNGYLNSRQSLIRSLQHIRTRTAVEEQLRHLMGVLEIMRSDEMGLRFLIPALMLRLNEDQKCYDFMKWYSLQGSRRYDAWSNPDMPFLDLKDADAFEDVTFVADEWNINPISQGINSAITLGLLKLRIILDLQTLQASAAAIGRYLPVELLVMIQGYVVRSDIVANKRALLEKIDHAEEIARLEAQVLQLLESAQRFNPRIWPLILSRRTVPMTPTFDPGTLEEAQNVVAQCSPGWAETPGAIEYLEKRAAHLRTVDSPRIRAMSRVMRNP